MENNIIKFPETTEEDLQLGCPCGCPVFHILLRDGYVVSTCVNCSEEMAEFDIVKGGEE